MTDGSIKFDQAADFYDETRGFPQGEEVHVAALMAAAGNLQRNSRVLEVGIGTGRIAAPLTNHVDTVYGIDLSVPMMSRIREKPGGERIRPVEANAGRLPFPTNTFDAIVVVHVFHLIPDISDPVREIQRVLKPEGRLLHSWNNSHGSIFSDLRRVFTEVAQRPGSQQGWERTMPILLENGWTKLERSHAHEYQQDETPQAFLDSFRDRRWSSTWALDDEDLEKGIDAMRAVAFEKLSDLNQPVTHTSKFYVDVFRPPA